MDCFSFSRTSEADGAGLQHEKHRNEVAIRINKAIWTNYGTGHEQRR